MTWQSISLENKELFEKNFKESRYILSDYNFTHQFIWKEGFNIRYKSIDDFLVIKGIDLMNNQPYIHMPMGKGLFDDVIHNLKEEFEKDGFPLVIKGITPIMKEDMESRSSLPFSYIKDRAEYEYLYATENFISFSNKNLRRKKELSHHFESIYDFSFLEYNSGLKSGVLDLIEKWEEENFYSKEQIIIYEKKGIIDVLNNYEQLNCTGFVLKINSAVIGFILVEPLTDEILLVHYEKSLRKYKGAYDILKKHMAKIFADKYAVFSLEEDMGVIGLRKAKKLYHPIKLVEKGSLIY